MKSCTCLPTPHRASKLVLLIALLPTLVLSGCSSIKVRLGLRLQIAKVPVSSMDASMPKDPAGVAPGEKSPLVVKFTQPDGKVLVTEGQGKGKVLWRDLAVAPTIVSVDKKGIVSTPHDPRKTDGKTGHVTITVPSHPDLKAELEIPLRYDYDFAANFSGSNGTSGIDGTAGSDGTNGSDGSIDATNPSPGGNGSSGGNGGNGSDGSDGGDGPDVQVRATLRQGGHPLLQLSVTAEGLKERFFLVDPQGGTLTVTASGGSGGSGGKGGRGGRGGSGGSGIPPGFSGSDGSAGRDGNNGRDGNPGKITLTYDPSVQPYLALIHLSSRGGPAPVLTEAPVSPLW